MKKARNKKIILLLAVCLIAALVRTENIKAAAGGSQDCTVDSSCVVGEFVYDDEYSPVTSATCNITSRYPDGSIFINNAAMTLASENDGWYSYSFTTPSTTGLYRTQVCCTVSGELMCIDKTVEVKEAESTPSNVASAVWSHSGRTLSSFGDLTSDIWTYSSRTVTSFGDLVTSIWSRSSRTVTGITDSSGDVTTGSDLSDIKSTVEENRILLDKLVNKPIIENVIEEEIPDLSSKLKETRAVANQLYVNNQYLTSQAGLLVSKWNVLSVEDLLTKTNEISEVLGEEGDKLSSDTVFGQADWIKDSWNWDEANSVYSNLINTRKRLTSVQEKLAFNQKDSAQYQEVKAIVKDLVAIEKIVGSSSDLLGGRTLYARIQTVEKTAIKLDQKQEELNSLYVNLAKSEDIKKLNPEVDTIRGEVIALNKIPKITFLLSKPYTTDLKAYKNTLLGLIGVINANKILLAKGAGELVLNTWIEVGSMVFRTLVTNPSKLSSQDVALKYYLPPEVKEEDILETDPDLTVSYDSEKGQYFVEGNVSLKIGETKTYEVKVNDVWVITKEEVESMRTQADELFKPLEKTSFYSQGVSLKSDINASLDKILSLQDNAVTPEQKIRAYREAVIEQDAVLGKLEGLKELVGQAGAAGSLFGFVGGAQALAVWGLIIIMGSGFVFLALYMRTITNADKTSGKKGKKGKKDESSKSNDNGKRLPIFKHETFKYLLPLFVTAILTTLVTAFATVKLTSGPKEDTSVLGEETSNANENVVDEDKENPDDLFIEGEGMGGLDIVKIVVPENANVKVYEYPVSEAKIIKTLDVMVYAIRLEEKGNLVRVVIGEDISNEGNVEGWVAKEYIVGRENQDESSDDIKTIGVDDIPTG